MTPTCQLVLGNKPKDHERARFYINNDERARSGLVPSSLWALHRACA